MLIQPKTIHVTLLRNDTPYITRVFDEIGIGAQFMWDTTLTLPTAGDYRYVVRVDSAFTATTGGRIPITTTDNSENIVADTPVLLSMSSEISAPLGAMDGIVSAGQAFTVEASLNNSGTASYDPGILRLNVPANYTVSQPDTSFSQISPTVTWTVQANNVSVLPFDTLTISVLDSALDRNINRAALLDTAYNDRILVRTEPKAAFAVLPLDIEPEGAKDFTISTGQLFSITAHVNFVGDLADSNRIARIMLPAGYSVVDSTIKPLITDSINWTVIAPNSPSTEGQPELISVRFSGVDDNSGQTVEAVSQILSFTTVSRATVDMAVAITDPPGAIDWSVTEGQDFTLQAWVSKQGTAGVYNGGSTDIQIDLADAPSFSLVNNDPIKLYQIDSLISWEISAGSFIEGASKQLVSLAKELYAANIEQANKTNTTQESISVINQMTEDLIEAGSGLGDRINQEENLKIILLSTPYDINAETSCPCLS